MPKISNRMPVDEVAISQYEQRLIRIDKRRKRSNLILEQSPIRKHDLVSRGIARGGLIIRTDRCVLDQSNAPIRDHTPKAGNSVGLVKEVVQRPFLQVGLTADCRPNKVTISLATLTTPGVGHKARAHRVSASDREECGRVIES